MSTSSPPPIESPCIGVCQFDHERQACSGCGRSLDHIANWARYSPAERRAIMQRLSESAAPPPDDAASDAAPDRVPDTS